MLDLFYRLFKFLRTMVIHWDCDECRQKRNNKHELEKKVKCVIDYESYDYKVM